MDIELIEKTTGRLVYAQFTVCSHCSCGASNCSGLGLADAESFRLAKQHGAWFDMDIYNVDYILAEGEKNGVYPESLAKEKEIGRKQRETFRAAHGAGVKMLFGTDAGVYPHGQNARQFAKMVEWGMTPMEAIQAATRSAAEALGRSADLGAIAPGRYADLIAVDVIRSAISARWKPSRS